MVSRKEWYARVNTAWPETPPTITAEEAVKAARKLWRWGMGEKYAGRIKVTSGNRYTWERYGVLNVNPTSTHHGGGWDALIHDLSHLLWRRANGGNAKPHEKGHAKFELAMRKEVLKRGWLNGSLKDKPEPEKPSVDPKAQKYRCIVIRMDRWLAKKKRAERALAKLSRARKYYERVGIAS